MHTETILQYEHAQHEQDAHAGGQGLEALVAILASETAAATFLSLAQGGAGGGWGKGRGGHKF
jgi:hypothetical protein